MAKKTKTLSVAAEPDLSSRLEEIAKKINPLLSVHKVHLALLEIALSDAESNPETLRRRLGL